MPPCTDYLAGYAEPEAQQAAAAGSLGPRLAHVVVLPACGEGEAPLQALMGLESPTLAILVLNARAAAPAWVHLGNRRTRAAVAAACGPGCTVPGRTPMTRHVAPWGVLEVIDRACDGHFLPEGQGVGLARKVGADIALAHIERGHVASRWIHCTDADVVLPPDYVRQTAGRVGAAAVYRFAHRLEADPLVALAMLQYETSLRYYVRGLQLAGSPYAFHTIGSTVALDAHSYAAVRGFPRRDAAEDFYILDKLRKVGDVVPLSGEPLQLSGRISQRVPFGTGRALWRLVTQGDGELPLYHPDSFVYLRAWHRVLAAAAREPIDVMAACAAQGVPQPHLLAQVVAALAGPAAVQRAHRGGRSTAVRRRHLSTWFDAFRTLKFVHGLRTLGLGMQPMAAALAHPWFGRPEAALQPRLAALARAEATGYLLPAWTHCPPASPSVTSTPAT